MGWEDQQIQTDNAIVRDRENRRSFVGNVLLGLAVVVVVLALIGGIAFWIGQIGQTDREKEITERERIQACQTVEDRALRSLCLAGLDVEVDNAEEGGR